MISELPVTTIAHAIQLAVAPVFLLTGVASILSVLTNRLSRIIDRSRFLHGKLLSAIETNPAIQVEIKSLKKRGHLIHWAIGLCTTCLLLICSVVAVLFIGSFKEFNMSELIIEVEQPVTRLPPHRSLRAELPHKALQNCSLAHGTH